MNDSANIPRVIVRRTGPTRVLSDWGRGGQRIANVRRYAREHGVAGYLRADGSFRVYWLEAGKIRQRTHKICRVVWGELAAV